MRTASEYRGIARSRLKGNWGSAILASLLAGLLGAGGNVSFPSLNIFEDFDISTLFSEGRPALPEMPELPFLPQSAGILLTALILLAIAAFSSVVLAIIGGALDLGHRKFYVRLIHGERCDIGVLFDYFKYLGKAFVLRLLTGLFVFLWTLLFFFPGIIAAYSYAMAPYLMAKDPSLSPMAALRMSKEMMRGKKLELFVLHLSFIGWSLLSSLVCGLGFIFLTPYMQAAEAAFALDLMGIGADLPGETPAASQPEPPTSPPPGIDNVFDA